MEEFLRKLGITLTGTVSNNSYTVDIPNSNKWGEIFSLLDNSELVEPMEDNQVITEQGTSLVYVAVDGPYMVSLLSDLEGDVYTLVVNMFGRE